MPEFSRLAYEQLLYTFVQQYLEVASSSLHLYTTAATIVEGDVQMPQLLEKAFAEVARLPQPEQEAFAAWILEELASERRWSKAFAQSQDVLAQLADEALAEHRAGQTQILDPDSL